MGGLVVLLVSIYQLCSFLSVFAARVIAFQFLNVLATHVFPFLDAFLFSSTILVSKLPDTLALLSSIFL